MPVARTRARSLSPVGSIASQISISTTQQIGRRSLTSTQSDHPSQIPDRPSPSRDGSIEKKPEEAPIRLKGSLKAPRPTIEPYTLHIPIAEGPQRKSITWSRSSRCYLYPSGRRRSSLTKRLMRHKTCPFLLICCLLPTVLIGALFFVLLPFGRADDTDDNKFDYYMHCERSNFIHLTPDKDYVFCDSSFLPVIVQ
ncbi:unnamed protein product, partial [Mesorhabditis spiculigera]